MNITTQEDNDELCKGKRLGDKIPKQSYKSPGIGEFIIPDGKNF